MSAAVDRLREPHPEQARIDALSTTILRGEKMSTEVTSEVLAKLAEPFPVGEIEFRAGPTNQAKTKAIALAYMTSRAVMNRLDDVVGPENWRDEYRDGPGGGVLCGISVLINGEWVTKWDGADNTNFEAVKGGLTDSFKRAAVKWGMGRYLYYLPGTWVAAEQRGKTVVLKSTPTMPDWAIPGGSGRPPKLDQPTIDETDTGEDDEPQKKPVTNGKAAGSSDAVTEYWSTVKDVGLNRDAAQQIVKECGGSFEDALVRVKSRYSEQLGEPELPF